MSHNFHFANSLYDGYENYIERSLTGRRFKHSDIRQLIERIKNNKLFKVDKVGKSVQGRDIFLISIGSGSKKIFCWSQMHGDEPTATASIFDIFNLFLSENHYEEFKRILLQNVTLFFIPMVNPDGAELFQRRNFQQIDLNRDALRLQSPESNILSSVFGKIKPDFGFNLHDQDRAYSAGKSRKSATISFLAPAYDNEKSVNERRSHAMSLIGEQYKLLSQFIPGHIGRYADDYEHRAFGDTFAKSDCSIILVESGGWRGDRNKELIRKINFISLLTSFKCIAEESYLVEPIETYDSIPLNENLMMDFIIRNVEVNQEGKDYIVDIAINYEEMNTDKYRDFYYSAKIVDIGDLSIYSGYEEFDATGLNLELGKTYSTVYNSIEEIENIEESMLLSEGITNVILNSSEFDDEYLNLIFNIVLNSTERVEELAIDKIPNFVLKEGETIKYYVINGFLIDKNNTGRKKGNALVFR
jgi:hypothetical protein